MPDTYCPNCGSYDLYLDFAGDAIMINSERTPLKCGDCDYNIDPRIFEVPPYDDVIVACCAPCGIFTFGRALVLVASAAVAAAAANRSIMTTKCYFCKRITVPFGGGFVRLCFGCSTTASTANGLCATCNGLPHRLWPTGTDCDASTHELSNNGKIWYYHRRNVACNTDSEDEDTAMANLPE